MAASQNLLVFQEELLPCPPLPIPSTPAHPFHPCPPVDAPELGNVEWIPLCIAAINGPSIPLQPPPSAAEFGWHFRNSKPGPLAPVHPVKPDGRCSLSCKAPGAPEGRKEGRNNELVLKAHPGLASFVQSDAGYK